MLAHLVDTKFECNGRIGHFDGGRFAAERVGFTVHFLRHEIQTTAGRSAFLENATWYILLFFLLVFSSDTFAFFCGMAFGRSNKGIIKVSPNKSIAGFIGGLLVPSVFGALSAILFPEVFAYGAAKGFILGLGTAALGVVGDLIESSFKRSAEVKDSGTLIPGRGGILDSVDSIIMAAPVYVALLMMICA